MKHSMKSNNTNVETYWYVAYVILIIILLILIGVLIYYVFFKTNKTTLPTTLPSSSPSPSSLPRSSSSPVPQSISQINSLLREQVKSWGDDFNSLPEEKKNKIRNCYTHPEECEF